ncbi:methyl-accepting chemotaxis protein [Dethiosulfovibrio salsuginis]|uniref:Methyl-accepting chemotaxis protein n=2 Tax=Dethiosulfovibrio salsuginis TaxID=561720 RepID=A0A1X7JXI4_9BACT|nr:methyl-accepting chemotaxis protein [Dethiosulfovibrio salsuginis]
MRFLSYMRKISIRARLVILVFLMVSFSVLTSFALIEALNSVSTMVGDLYGRGSKGAVTAYEAADGMNQVAVNLYRALNASDPEARRGFGARVMAGHKALGDALERLSTLDLSSNGKALLENSVEVFRVWSPMTDSLVSVLERGGYQQEFMAIASSGAHLTMKLDDSIKKLVAAASASMEQVYGDILIRRDTTKRNALWIVIAVTSLSVLLSALVVLSISRPVGAIVREIRSVAQSMDLTHRGSKEGKDEITAISNAMDSLFDAFEGAMIKVKDMSCELSGHAQTFSATAEEANATVEEVIAQVDRTGDMVGNLAANTEEINASVGEVAAGSQSAAGKSSDVAEQVEDARRSGQEGLLSVKKAVRAVIKVADESRSSMERVRDLGVRAQEIQSFVSDIGSIADQTNLLALNAAIEAARAGEHGRGFAVVAEEVRKLAEQSNASAGKISDLAKEISGDLQAVISLVEGNEGQATQARADAEGAEELIETILTSLAAIAAASQDMAAVATEQAASSEEITTAVQNMANRTGDVAEISGVIRSQMKDVGTVAEQVAVGSESLAAMAETLQMEVNRFNVSTGKGLMPNCNR